MLASLLAWWNANAGPSASLGGLLGGLIGSAVASRAAVRRKWRAEASAVVLEHCHHACPRADGATRGAA